MKIAILGTGNVGQALGKGWANAGHTVIFGSRHPDENSDLTSDHISIATVSEAISQADIVTLAIPWSGVEATLTTYPDWTGKTIIDATNPIGEGFKLISSNGGTEVANWAKGAKVVKAFNTTGYNNMLDAIYNGEATAMFIAGDDEAAKTAVTQLATDLGFAVEDVGGLKTAGDLESLAMVWISLAIKHGRELAFKVVRR